MGETHFLSFNTGERVCHTLARSAIHYAGKAKGGKA